ncbi:hypothetical protein F4802DRAFT_609078 [Xylaria palmicola]|nr:hypothetical protein F4802DRAFT_609078 [Xylaria palmicola]
MFQTLKARRSNTGESAYVVQSAGIPFEKNKGKKQRACVLCKLKKLKCVAEGDSCVKCSKQGLECSYKTASKSNTGSASKPPKKASKSETPAHQPATKQAKIPIESTSSDLSITVGDTAASSSSSSSSSNSTPSISDRTEPPLLEEFSFADLLENDLTFDFWSLSNEGSMDIGDASIYLAAANGGENTCELAAVSGMHPSKSNHDFLMDYAGGVKNVTGNEAPVVSGRSPQTISQTTSTPVTELLSWESSLIPEIQTPSLIDHVTTAGQDAVTFSAVHGSGVQETMHPQDPHATCNCLEKLMGANEDMQVKLVWGAYPLNGVTVSVDDMLQCQKDILVSCETLLECQRCSLRSDYVMLIVSMCHEMMNGIGDLSAMLLPGEQTGSSKRTRSESDGGRKRGLKAGGWRLDDEDEIQVIRSLIGIRITRLGSLISLLEKAVKDKHPAYEWVIQALRQSIKDRIASIGSEKEGVGFTVDI